MSHVLTATPITAEAFAPFGDLLEVRGTPDKLINQGMCGRHHDLATLDFGPGGRAGISLFDAKARHFPHTVDMVERHPEGSQAFIPVSGTCMIVVVAEDAGGTPKNLRAFTTAPGQSINLHRNIWHGVLAPIGKDAQYIVVDRIGETPNLEEHWFEQPFTVEESS